MRPVGETREEWKRHYRRMVRVSLLVLFLEVPVLIVLNVLRDPGPEAINRVVVGLIVFFPFDVLLGAFPGALLTYFVVLPAVGLSEVLGRRFGGREEWWVPVLPATVLAPLGVLAALTGIVAPLAAWGVWVVLLTVAALFARIAREGLLVDIALWGTLFWLCVGVSGPALDRLGAV
ncbi:hypothetical protein [Streptomyces sp. NPDC002690]